MNNMTRRDIIRCLAAISASSAFPLPMAMAVNPSSVETNPDHSSTPQLRMGSEEIAILVYSEFTALDALGPHYVLSGMMGAKVRFVAKTSDVVPCEGASMAGFRVKPHMTFADCPDRLDLLLVPGGVKGTISAINDRSTREFIADRGGKAKLVGSVCTGSLLLGAAGLLRGRRATSHWQTIDLLPLIGATPVAQRVVFDGEDRVTAAGVTAGIDLGFRLLQKYRGDFYAKGMQLLGEYDPQPLFDGGGKPSTADPKVVQMLEMMHEPICDAFKSALASAKKEDAS